MTKQKTAIVCDWLTGVGGAEKVILAVHKMYPDAPIYTSQYRPSGIDWFKNAEVKTGWLNVFPAGLKRFIPFLRQLYFSRLDLSYYDVVISITGAEAKAVKTGPKTLHVSYMHAPTQYYWTLYDQYLKDPGFGWLNPIVRTGLKLLVGPLRKADYRSAQGPDVIVANSTYIQDEIQKFYHRDSVVIWPNVNTETIAALAHKDDRSAVKRQGFITYGRQVGWKKIDIAIAAAMKVQKNLLVIGDGPENARLRKIADGSKYIRFMPKYNGIEEIVDYIASSEAYIFPSIEPFGIAPVESLAAGTPVIGLKKGGALDIIKDGVNGLFFDEQTVESLAEAMNRFKDCAFDESVVTQTSQAFSEAEFSRQLRELIDKSLITK